MKGRPGVAGKVFDSLGRQNINISAIAQGASERNISCVIDAAQQVRALNAIHQGVLRDAQAAGAGDDRRRQHRQRGAAAAAPAALVSARRRDSTSRSSALANSRRFVADANGINLAHWKDELRGASSRMDAAAFAERDRRHGADQRGAGRLHRRTRRRRRLSGVHRRQPAHHHAEQVGERAAVAALCGADGGAGARASGISSSRPTSAPACRSCRRCAISSPAATRSSGSKASCPARSAIYSTPSTARCRSARWCATRTAWGSPSPIHVRICRGRTSRGSC